MLLTSAFNTLTLLKLCALAAFAIIASFKALALSLNDLSPCYVSVEFITHCDLFKGVAQNLGTFKVSFDIPKGVFTYPAIDSRILNIAHYNLLLVVRDLVFNDIQRIYITDIPNNINYLKALINGLAAYADTLFIKFRLLNLCAKIVEDLDLPDNPAGYDYMEDYLDTYKAYLGAIRYLEQIVRTYDSTYISRIPISFVED